MIFFSLTPLSPLRQLHFLGLSRKPPFLTVFGSFLHGYPCRFGFLAKFGFSATPSGDFFSVTFHFKHAHLPPCYLVVTRHEVFVRADVFRLGCSPCQSRHFGHFRVFFFPVFWAILKRQKNAFAASIAVNDCFR